MLVCVGPRSLVVPAGCYEQWHTPGRFRGIIQASSWDEISVGSGCKARALVIGWTSHTKQVIKCDVPRNKTWLWDLNTSAGSSRLCQVALHTRVALACWDRRGRYSYESEKKKASGKKGNFLCSWNYKYYCCRYVVPIYVGESHKRRLPVYTDSCKYVV